MASASALFPPLPRGQKSAEPRRTHSEKPLSRRKSNRLLSTVKSLVHRPSKSVGAIPPSHSTPQISRFFNDSPPMRATSLPAGSALEQQFTPTRRGQTPGMDDYLTLSELENVWVTQDTYVGCVQAPIRPAKHTFEEVAEVPTVVKHHRPPRIIIPPVPAMPIITPPAEESRPPARGQESRPTTRVQESWPPRRGQESWPPAMGQESRLPTRGQEPGPPTRGPDVVVHGVVHPAFRPLPGPRPDSSELKNPTRESYVHPALRPAPYFKVDDAAGCRVASKFAVSVPASNWTNGRLCRI